MEKCACGMLLTKEVACKCQPKLCCHCCGCKPECGCGCQEKAEKDKE